MANLALPDGCRWATSRHSYRAADTDFRDPRQGALSRGSRQVGGRASWHTRPLMHWQPREKVNVSIVGTVEPPCPVPTSAVQRFLSGQQAACFVSLQHRRGVLSFSPVFGKGHAKIPHGCPGAEAACSSSCIPRRLITYAVGRLFLAARRCGLQPRGRQDGSRFQVSFLQAVVLPCSTGWSLQGVASAPPALVGQKDPRVTFRRQRDLSSCCRESSCFLLVCRRLAGSCVKNLLLVCAWLALCMNGEHPAPSCVVCSLPRGASAAGTGPSL